MVEVAKTLDGLSNSKIDVKASPGFLVNPSNPSQKQLELQFHAISMSMPCLISRTTQTHLIADTPRHKQKQRNGASRLIKSSVCILEVPAADFACTSSARVTT